MAELYSGSPGCVWCHWWWWHTRGIHFVPTKDGSIAPLLWWQKFPDWIWQQLVLPITVFWARPSIYKYTQFVISMTTWPQFTGSAKVSPARLLDQLLTFFASKTFYFLLYDYIPSETNKMSEYCWDLSHNQLFTPFQLWISPGHSLVLMSTAQANVVQSDLSYIQEAIWSCLTAAFYSKCKDNQYKIYSDYCLSQNVDPFLEGIQNPIAYLQLFRWVIQRWPDCPLLCALQQI